MKLVSQLKAVKKSFANKALCAESCIKIARPNWREPITITAIIKVNMLAQIEKTNIANAIVKKQWDTKNAPMKLDLRANGRISSEEKYFFACCISKH